MFKRDEQKKRAANQAQEMLVEKITKATLDTVLRSLTNDQRANYEGNVTHAHDHSDLTYIKVYMKCTKCEHPLVRTVKITDEAIKSTARRASSARELADAITEAVKGHNDRCPSRASAQAAARLDKDAKEKPPTKKKKQPSCTICKTTDRKYPPWQGPCSHLLDMGMKYKPFDKLAKEYGL